MERKFKVCSEIENPNNKEENIEINLDFNINSFPKDFSDLPPITKEAKEQLLKIQIEMFTFSKRVRKILGWDRPENENERSVHRMWHSELRRLEDMTDREYKKERKELLCNVEAEVTRG